MGQQQSRTLRAARSKLGDRSVAQLSYTFDSLVNLQRGMDRHYGSTPSEQPHPPHTINVQTFRTHFFRDIPDMADRLFNGIDKDRNGYIDKEEFIVAMALVIKGDRGSKYQFIFSLFDKDNDGVVTRAEMSALLSTAYFASDAMPVSSSGDRSSGIRNHLEAERYRVRHFLTRISHRRKDEEEAGNATRGVVGALVDEAFHYADRDKNGELSQLEFVTWAAKTPKIAGIWERLEMEASLPVAGAGLGAAYEEVHEAVSANNMSKVARILGESPSLVVAEDQNGLLPVHVAAEHNHCGMVALLLRYKSPLDSTDALGRTPLHMACAGGALQMVYMLLRAGANSDITDLNGNTILHYLVGQSIASADVGTAQVRAGVAIEAARVFSLLLSMEASCTVSNMAKKTVMSLIEDYKECAGHAGPFLFANDSETIKRSISSAAGGDTDITAAPDPSEAAQLLGTLNSVLARFETDTASTDLLSSSAEIATFVATVSDRLKNTLRVVSDIGRSAGATVWPEGSTTSGDVEQCLITDESIDRRLFISHIADRIFALDCSVTYHKRRQFPSFDDVGQGRGDEKEQRHLILFNDIFIVTSAAEYDVLDDATRRSSPRLKYLRHFHNRDLYAYDVPSTVTGLAHCICITYNRFANTLKAPTHTHRPRLRPSAYIFSFPSDQRKKAFLSGIRRFGSEARRSITTRMRSRTREMRRTNRQFTLSPATIPMIDLQSPSTTVKPPPSQSMPTLPGRLSATTPIGLPSLVMEDYDATKSRASTDGVIGVGGGDCSGRAPMWRASSESQLPSVAPRTSMAINQQQMRSRLSTIEPSSSSPPSVPEYKPAKTSPCRPNRTVSISSFASLNQQLGPQSIAFQAYVNKRKRTTHSWKRRYCRLCASQRALFFYLSEKCRSTQPHSFLSLDGYAMVTTTDNDEDTGDTRFTLSPVADGNPAVVRVHLCGENPHQSKQWRTVIQQLIDGETLSVSSSHDFMDKVHTLPGRIKKYAGHRFGSFCPPRLQERAHWYVDGVEYFPKVFKAIENAKSQIMIADWMLNPEMYLIRPYGRCPNSPHKDDPAGQLIQHDVANRLDRTLLRAAKRGVNIYLLLWYESLAMGGAVNNTHARKALEDLHENIEVVRHPIGTINFWSHHQKFVVIDQSLAFVGGLDLCFGRWDTPVHRLGDDCELAQTWPGKDLHNPKIKDFFELDNPSADCFDRTKNPRMPWHDVHLSFGGKAASDVAWNFVQRWNHHISDREDHKRYEPLALWPEPKGGDRLGRWCGKDRKHTSTVQVLRSIGNWSCGTSGTEASIEECYVRLIMNAEHYIYIENQFFVSSLPIHGVNNQIMEALYQRIVRAIENNEQFRAYVVLPENMAGNMEDATTKHVSYWQYTTISRGRRSILHRLRAKYGDDLGDYRIDFFALRNYDVVGGELKSDQVYVHTKLLIVDDQHVVCGSANINERSMAGNRDSEICAYVRDNKCIESKMDNKFYMASKFARDLRMRLWREHLGATDDECEFLIDPLCQRTHWLWCGRANMNLTALVTVFPNMPHSNYRTIHAQMHAAKQSKTTGTEHLMFLQNTVRGHVIEFPLHYLADEALKPTLATAAVEKALPESIFQ
eukprot:TRINITY_DN5200_c0_g1_i1.p1 TRINITY_DN5200_c0_g1~~TRINITY_DN5200_c0_g1_i1.p1  ORF type:complete len:1602 (+),score=295.86 TRINITY_DN5200_c0_g1_i1:186-4991(+)